MSEWMANHDHRAIMEPHWIGAYFFHIWIHREQSLKCYDKESIFCWFSNVSTVTPVQFVGNKRVQQERFDAGLYLCIQFFEISLRSEMPNAWYTMKSSRYKMGSIFNSGIFLKIKTSFYRIYLTTLFFCFVYYSLTLISLWLVLLMQAM